MKNGLIASAKSIYPYQPISAYTKQQNFTLVHIEGICRQQNKCKLKTESFGGWAENIAGKEENAGYQHFLLLPQCFQMASFSGSLKVGIVW